MDLSTFDMNGEFDFTRHMQRKSHWSYPLGTTRLTQNDFYFVLYERVVFFLSFFSQQLSNL